MPKDDPDVEDPMELCMETVACGPEADALQAEVFIEEFALMGYSRDFVLRLFKDPHYAGAHRLLLAHGEDWVRDRMRAVLGRWRKVGG
jgi:hypothetical protein